MHRQDIPSLAPRSLRAWLGVIGVLSAASLFLLSPAGPSGAETPTTTDSTTTTEATTTTAEQTTTSVGETTAPYEEATTTVGDVDDSTTSNPDDPTSTSEEVEVISNDQTNPDDAVTSGTSVGASTLARTGLDTTGLAALGTALIVAGGLALWARRRLLLG